MTAHETERQAFADHLVKSGRTVAEATDIAEVIVLDNFADADGSVDTQKLHEFADRFRLTAPRRRPNFGGGGDRGPGGGRLTHSFRPGIDDRSDGELEAERRFGKKPEPAQEDDRYRNPEARRRFGGNAQSSTHVSDDRSTFLSPESARRLGRAR